VTVAAAAQWARGDPPASEGGPAAPAFPGRRRSATLGGMPKPKPQTEISLAERKAIGRDAALTGLMLLAAAVVASLGGWLLTGRTGLRVGYVGLGVLGLLCLVGGCVQWATGRGGFGRKLGAGFGTFVPLLVLATVALAVLPWLLDHLL
jgi:hypothetical protein